MKLLENNGTKLATFQNTPQINVIREQLHLEQDFNKFFKKSYIKGKVKPENFTKENSERIKFESDELNNTQILQKKINSLNGEEYYKGDHKAGFKLTDNGYYAYKAGYYHHVLYIDNHSLLPTMFMVLDLLDEKRKNLFWEKKDIEKLNYKQIPRKNKRRSKIKLAINTYCSTSTWTDEQRKSPKKNPVTSEQQLTSSINRRAAMYSGANLVYEEMQFFGFDKIVNVVNDGFIVDLSQYYHLADESNYSDEDKKHLYNCIYKDSIEPLINQFLDYFAKEIPYLTFTIKEWDHCFVKTAQEYLLLNDPAEGQQVTDYKLRNTTLSQSAYYASKIEGHSLKDDKSKNIVNKDVEAEGKKFEMENINLLYQAKLNHNNNLEDFLQQQETKKKIEQLLTSLGIDKVKTKAKDEFHAYQITVDEKETDPKNKVAIDFMKLLTENNVFYIKDVLPPKSYNMLHVYLTINEIDDLEPDNKSNNAKSIRKNTIVREWSPWFIFPKDEKLTMNKWIKSIMGQIKLSENEHLIQEKLLESIVQIIAVREGENPNNYLELFEKIKDEKAYKNWTLADKVRADHRVIVVDGEMYVLDPKKQVYTQDEESKVALIQEYMSLAEKNNIDASLRSVYRNFKSTSYSIDQLDEGVRTPTGAITFKPNSDGLYQYQQGSYFEGKYTQTTSIIPDDSIKSYNDIQKDPYGQQLWVLLNSVSGGQPVKLVQALGTIFTRQLAPQIRNFFELYGVPGSGKSLLASMVAEIFDGITPSPAEESKVLTGSADINQVLNPQYVENYGVKNGQVVLWLDDFVGKNKTKNIILDHRAAANINRITSLQSISTNTKYKNTDTVLLPHALFISSNKLIDPTINEGTDSRLFVFQSKKSLKDNEEWDPESVPSFKTNKQVLGMLLKLMILGAEDIYKYAYIHGLKSLVNFFDDADNAYKKNKNKMINDHFQAFIEEHDIESPYTFVGMQVSKLFKKYHADELGDHSASLASFKEQLSTIGLKIGDKKIRGKNYRKVILSSNKSLNKQKLDYLWNQYQVTPADVVELRMNDNKDDWKEFGTYSQWGEIEGEMQRQFPQEKNLFIKF